jgi:hypothetical protein
MHPHKERPFLVDGQPSDSVSYDLITAPFNCLVAVFPRSSPVETGIVGVKSPIKAGG